ncbi:transcriptional regulator [Bernardetia litoralis DSM 6794]|uniref:Transcriptional regulator n=1 Tax=Bernardetia litoralis (strain ATCC 23117 / DSM 6794 / NBRC 15988 / NCIMB 1366 / Fx l1 / Sio-4) TaxID=880071 RepID=I4AM25_BERLS|nr:Lrp/AsnC family transcriptional regulator [Bernardetia litoralis]AFM05010.1 transcriptional regulator [Bernardetia litoralis DSM 6794]
MALHYKIDQIDKQILEILQENAKITNAQLSKDINLSPAPTLERVKKLENAGYIKSYHARLDAQKLGLGVATFVSVKLNKHNKVSNENFVKQVRSIDEIVECHYVTGSSDYVLKVVSKDIDSYQNLIMNKISEISEVDNMQTMVILNTIKDSDSLPIPEATPALAKNIDNN